MGHGWSVTRSAVASVPIAEWAAFGPTPDTGVHRAIASKCLHAFGCNGSSETTGVSEQSNGTLESRDVPDTHHPHA